MSENDQMRTLLIAVICTLILSLKVNQTSAQNVNTDCEKLRSAISDLIETFGSRYLKGSDYLNRLQNIESRLQNGDTHVKQEFETLR